MMQNKEKMKYLVLSHICEVHSGMMIDYSLGDTGKVSKTKDYINTSLLLMWNLELLTVDEWLECRKLYLTI